LPPTPKSIKLAGGDNTLAVEWSDGHLSRYPYRYLRGRCPCANCHGAGLPPEQAAGALPMFGVKPLAPARAELVGRYALQIFWNDGHSSGIYSFDYLRELCPCEECSRARQSLSNNS
jgi:DUF971 family protein